MPEVISDVASRDVDFPGVREAKQHADVYALATIIGRGRGGGAKINININLKLIRLSRYSKNL